jgi:putative NIF3 family GTP cyclohydrolase 1 type 2
MTTDPAPAAATHLTAREIVARIQREVDVPWREQTVDTFKYGDPDRPVTGIAVTMIPTYDVIEAAAAGGANLLIPHEPLFYDHHDAVNADLESDQDAVWLAKRDLLLRHGIVVWRFHDHWHMRRPDGVLTGQIGALGWGAYQDPDEPRVFHLPQTTLAELAADLAQRLGGVRAARVVGDPGLPVSGVALNPGYGDGSRLRRLLRRDNVEVLVVGESREWEIVEYAADAVAAGHAKGLVVLGHIPSEQAGMEECARWLRTFVPEVPIVYVPTPEPFWVLR